jgi:glycosyltransferase involved in cell wall biosynthesis
MRVVRILVWHGWLLEGSGSNVATARIVEVWRAAGHDVLLLCQERHPDRYRWIDASGTITGDGVSPLTPNPDAAAAAGRCVLLRPEIGTLLPVFVVDHYEGFVDVRSFVDLSDQELESYLTANVEAVRAAADAHRPDVSIVGHGIPGAAIGRRALGAGSAVAKIHGSDLEYAIRPQARYRALAAEGLGAARAVVGPTGDVLRRCAELVPDMVKTVHVVPPGVDVAAFRPRPRSEALRDVVARLSLDPATARGRPSALDAEVERALEARDDGAIDALFDRYDEDVPEPDAADRLRRLAERDGPVVGYLGKLIPQKGVELFLEALPTLRHDATALVVGFGSDRDWLAALVIALRRGDREAVAWLREAGGLPVDPATIPDASPRGPDVSFTGLLDHRYAPGTLAAMDVQVVPSILEEAFGMVAAEGAAAGALPLVARHSGLAEVAGALEAHVGRPGLFSFEPGAGAVRRLADGIDELLSLPPRERDELRRAVSSFVAEHWTWERTATKLLAAAGVHS